MIEVDMSFVTTLSKWKFDYSAEMQYAGEVIIGESKKSCQTHNQQNGWIIFLV
jgi:hypothetical protein